MSTDMWAVLVAVIIVHMIAAIMIGYQIINLLEEIAFPSDDPIMTSTLDGFADIDAPESEEEPEEELEEELEETQTAFVTVNQLRRMKKDELIGLCDSMGLDTNGTKNDLVTRISKNQ